ncbi:MAG: heavy metal-responsive transcriptional regulator [Myxococcales bacterium]|nr:heavy metal-responsive transcriptional regulator [Myxococcales bacterium]
MSEGTFTIGVLARRAGVGVQTVRYYERIGLLPRAGRAKGGYRRYGEEAVARLQFIRHAARLGFTLAETKELLTLRARRGAPCGAVRTRAEEKLAAIERKLAELRELRDAVAHLVHACSGGTAVEHCSILAALSRQPETDNNQPETGKKEKGSCPPPPRPVRRPTSRVSRRANAASKTA